MAHLSGAEKSVKYQGEKTVTRSNSIRQAKVAFLRREAH
jgi:hypothetical protein